MTSDQKSAPEVPPRRDDAPYLGVESPGGAWHPHMIEVQEFSAYGLIVDVRSAAAYGDDHIPGAVRLEPPVDLATAAALGKLVTTDVAPALQTMVDAMHSDDGALLLYDGNGGLVAEPLAAALRQQGREVDVLAGGWINYRRWVQAGLQLLPRLFEWRVIGGSTGGEASTVLDVLREQGHQVLDVGALAQASQIGIKQTSQNCFESRLVDAMRQMSGRHPVWTSDSTESAGSPTVPVALLEALSIAPFAALEVSAAARIQKGQHDEPVDAKAPERSGHRHQLPPLVIQSFEREAISAAIGRWMPAPI